MFIAQDASTIENQNNNQNLNQTQALIDLSAHLGYESAENSQIQNYNTQKKKASSHQRLYNLAKI